MRETIRWNDRELANIEYLKKLLGSNKNKEALTFALNVATNWLQFCHRIADNDLFSLYFIRDKNLTKAKLGGQD